MTTPATAARLGLLQISLAGVLWGTGGLAVQLVREQVPMHVVTISAWRMVLAGVVLAALLLALRGGPVLRDLLRTHPRRTVVVVCAIRGDRPQLRFRHPAAMHGGADRKRRLLRAESAGRAAGCAAGADNAVTAVEAVVVAIEIV